MRTLKFPLELDGNGELILITGLAALRQKIDQRLALFKDTWFLNTNRGVPYLQEIIKKPVDPGLVASILNAEILKETEVLSVGAVSADLDRETRKFTYGATITTIYGILEYPSVVKYPSVPFVPQIIVYLNYSDVVDYDDIIVYSTITRV